MIFLGVKRIVNVLFSKHLFMTNTVIGGALLGLGDVIEQTIEIRFFKSSTKYDWPRTGRMAVTGFGLGMVGHGWYKILDGYLPGTTPRTVFRKVALDLLVAGPIYAWLFFWGMGVLERRSLEDIWTDFKLKFPYVFAFDCILWPPAQTLNFLYISPTFRVLYVEILVLFWDVVLSYIKHTDLGKKL